MKNVIYDFCDYDKCIYEKHVYDKSIMTFDTVPNLSPVLQQILLDENFKFLRV